MGTTDGESGGLGFWLGGRDVEGAVPGRRAQQEEDGKWPLTFDLVSGSPFL